VKPSLYAPLAVGAHLLWINPQVPLTVAIHLRLHMEYNAEPFKIVPQKRNAFITLTATHSRPSLLCAAGMEMIPLVPPKQLAPVPSPPRHAVPLQTASQKLTKTADSLSVVNTQTVVSAQLKVCVLLQLP